MTLAPVSRALRSPSKDVPASLGDLLQRGSLLVAVVAQQSGPVRWRLCSWHCAGVVLGVGIEVCFRKDLHPYPLGELIFFRGYRVTRK